MSQKINYNKFIKRNIKSLDLTNIRYKIKFYMIKTEENSETFK